MVQQKNIDAFFDMQQLVRSSTWAQLGFFLFFYFALSQWITILLTPYSKEGESINQNREREGNFNKKEELYS